MRVVISWHPYRNFLLYIFFIQAILMNVKWYFLIFWFVFLYWFMISSIFSCVFLSFVAHLWETIKICHFLIRWSVFLLCIYKSSLYIMNKSVSDIWFDIWFVIIFSFYGLCFYFLDGIVVCRTKVNHIDKVYFFLFFHFLFCLLCVWYSI